MAEKKKPRDGKDSGKDAEDERISLAIELLVPDGLSTKYANHFIVQRTQNETFLLFFEVHPPLILGTPEEVEEQKKNLKSIKATCVARIAVSNKFLPEIVKAVGQHQERVRVKESGRSNGEGKGE